MGIETVEIGRPLGKPDVQLDPTTTEDSSLHLPDTPLKASLEGKTDPNLCPHCGKVDDTLSSKYCPGHAFETLVRYLARRPDSPLNQGLNRLTAASQQPITPHAA